MLDFITNLKLFASSSGLELRFVVNLIAMLLFLYFIYYRRYRNKELVTAAALFNIFVFSVLSVLSSVDFGLSAGFGLFAILALFTLRSEPLGKIELTYFFGAVAIAVICSIQGTPLVTVLFAVAIVLIGTYFLDHPRILKSISSAKIFLDSIDPELLSNPAAMNQKLSNMLNVDVLSFNVLQIDYLTEKVTVDVYFRKHSV